MPENNQTPLSDDYGKIKSPFLTKLENFFYHYKWHTIIALFIIFTVTVCMFQMCRKQSYDIHILYAGGTSVSMSVSEGEAESHRVTLINASKRFCKDYDNDVMKNIDFSTLYIPTSEQIKEIENAAGDYSVDYNAISQNKDAFSQHMIIGDYYIVLMSKTLCEELVSRGENNPLANISPYLPANHEEMGYKLLGDFGVYLSSTPLYQNPGFSKLGSDTVICIRRYSEINKSKKSEEYHKRSEEILKLMLEDKSAS